jgi:hypothetical protein
VKRTGKGRCLIEGQTIEVEEVGYVDKSCSEKILNPMEFAVLFPSNSSTI